MRNLAAFASAEEAPLHGAGGLRYADSPAEALRQALIALPRDKDNIIVPEMWRHSVAKWEKQPMAWRAQQSIASVRQLEKRLTQEFQKARRTPRAPATRFTTDAAVKWGRRQGYKLIDREHYDYRTKRHRDLEGAVDAIFEGPDGSRIGVQGAGKSERASHLAKFESWGGAEKAKRRGLQVWYLEFERGNPEPIFKERWA